MENGTLKPVNAFALLYLFLYEVLGTFILTTFASLSTLYNPAVIVPGAFFVTIIFCGGVSGAHVNAAVTLGVYIIEGQWLKNLKLLFTYWIA